MIEIKPAVAKPGRKTGRPSSYPFADMRIGGMFEVLVRANVSAAVLAEKIRRAGAAYRRRVGVACSYVVRHCNSRGDPLINSAGRQVVRVWCEEPIARGKSPKGNDLDAIFSK